MAKPPAIRHVTYMDKVLDLTNADDRAMMAELTASAVRLRSFGAAMSVIADKLLLGSDDEAEYLISLGLRQVMADTTDEIRARQQATINDIKRAMWPGTQMGDQQSAQVMIKALEHEGKLHPGLFAPTKVHIGLDQDQFTTTAADDLRAIGVDPSMDTPLVIDAEDDEPWSNT